MQNIRFLAERAKVASVHLGLLSNDARREIIERIAAFLEQSSQKILDANALDMRAAEKNKIAQSMLDRLLLTKERLKANIASVRNVAELPDYLGTVIEDRELKNGLLLKRVRVPIGVIGMIYEARPNVTMDAAVLCIKSGNAVILKGGSDALLTNRAIVKAMQAALQEISGLSPESRLQDIVQLINTPERKATLDLLQLHGLIDVIIPRGNKGLIDFVRENSKIPVIETGASVVHTYVDSEADLKKAVDIILNAKLRRTGICNTLDTLLIHVEVAKKLLKDLVCALPNNPYNAKKLEIRADTKSFQILSDLNGQKIKKNGARQNNPFDLKIVKAKTADFDTEFLDYILAVKIVADSRQAIDHITHHSLKHSEAIVTENAKTAELFLHAVDAACVYWNASTQFSDGGEFGLGAEIGISTQKLHVRGPFALEGLTSYKWVVEGSGQIRP